METSVTSCLHGGGLDVFSRAGFAWRGWRAVQVLACPASKPPSVAPCPVVAERGSIAGALSERRNGGASAAMWRDGEPMGGDG